MSSTPVAEKVAEKPAKPVGEKPAKVPVIQLVRGADFSPGERVLHRVLPACVASAGLHLLLAGGVGLYAWLNPAVEAKPTVQEVAVAVEPRQDAPEADNLTEADAPLDDVVATTALDDTDKLDTKTIETKVIDPEPAGNPDGNLTTPIDSKLAAGADAAEMLKAGMDATLSGVGLVGGGAGGEAIANPSFKGRGESSTRDALAKAYGGTTESQKAVAQGLIWLARQQRKDGSWEFDGAAKYDKVAATGMALLPFLAAGQTHKPGKDNKYQEQVEKGLAWLLKQQRTDGSFANGMYSNAIAAVAVCEAFGMTADKVRLLRPAQKAVEFIEGAQGLNGSWGYEKGTEGDTSIVGWQIQVLHSAKLCKDLKVNPRVLDKAVRFLDSVATGAGKSRYGYQKPLDKKEDQSLTAVGLLCRYYLNGWTRDTPGMRDGVNYLLGKHPPAAEAGYEYDMYYYYYATQVMHFHEGPVWEKEWNPKMREFLIGKQQTKDERSNVHGSWDPDTSRWVGPQCGRLGTTCLALLTLEVYYRHLPLYNRGTGGRSDLEGK